MPSFLCSSIKKVFKNKKLFILLSLHEFFLVETSFVLRKVCIKKKEKN